MDSHFLTRRILHEDVYFGDVESSRLLQEFLLHLRRAVWSIVTRSQYLHQLSPLLLNGCNIFFSLARSTAANPNSCAFITRSSPYIETIVNSLVHRRDEIVNAVDAVDFQRFPPLFREHGWPAAATSLLR